MANLQIRISDILHEQLMLRFKGNLSEYLRNFCEELVNDGEPDDSELNNLSQQELIIQKQVQDIVSKLNLVKSKKKAIVEKKRIEQLKKLKEEQEAEDEHLAKCVEVAEAFKANNPLRFG